MSKAIFEKKLNKWIVGAVIWTTLLWVWWFGMSNKWKWFFWKLKQKAKKLKSFLNNWLKEMKKEMKK